MESTTFKTMMRILFKFLGWMGITIASSVLVSMILYQFITFLFMLCGLENGNMALEFIKFFCFLGGLALVVASVGGVFALFISNNEVKNVFKGV